MVTIPDDLKYSSTHLWVDQAHSGLVKVGITEFAQMELGDIVYIELPEIEQFYEDGAECRQIESVNTTIDIYCPVTGEIIDINRDLEESSEMINIDCYGDGWIFLLKPDNERDIDHLIDAADYAELIEG